MGSRTLSIDPETVKGFLHPEEGERLYDLAVEAAVGGPCLEIGSYCGKSTLYLGSACRARGELLFAVDHHRGSEEHQPGEAYHDPDLRAGGRVDSFGTFRDTLARAGLEDTVVPIVAGSATAARHWHTPLSLVFIDGGHSFAAARTDYRCWAGHLQSGGILAIHDLFPDPTEGGQAPIEIYRLALASGLYEALDGTRTLGVLRRLPPAAGPG